MHIRILSLYLIFVGGCFDGQSRDASVTEYAQRIDVAQLDSSLPSQPLERWLEELAAQDREVRWRQTECGLKHVGDEPGGGWPLCADFMFEQRGVSVRGSIVVGTLREGIGGDPKFLKAWINTAELSREGRGDVAGRLSEIPALIAKYGG